MAPNFREHASRVVALATMLFASFGALAADLAPNAPPVMLTVPGSYTYGDSFSASTGAFAIKGTVTGTSGSSYSGALNLAGPVPEPSQSLALLAGLMLLGFQLRRTLKDRD